MMSLIDYIVEINQFGDDGGMSGPRFRGANMLQTTARSTSWHVPSNTAYWMYNHPWALLMIGIQLSNSGLVAWYIYQFDDTCIFFLPCGICKYIMEQTQIDLILIWN